MDLRAAVDRLVEEGTDWIKLFGTLGPENELQYSIEELSAVVDEAHKNGVKVAMHTIVEADSQRAVASGVDNTEHGVDIAEEDLKKMSQSNIAFVPTMSVMAYASTLPGRNDNAIWTDRTKRSNATFERALRANVKIVFGTDSCAVNWTSNPVQQLQVMVSHGMTPLQAIRSATIDGANLLGMSKQVGSVEVGKFADIIGVQGDPLTDVSRIEKVVFVMKDGLRFDLNQE